MSRNDGSHAFASTLAEHNRNVRKYPGGVLQQEAARK
ncbi:MAG: endolytic transglycosylase MltG [Ignavibacteriales bacterium]|nr:endolytic transglycosylase MltG [Ignavibacteriales bacterium]